MPRKKKKRGRPMSEAAKAWLKASDKGSYYKQAALLDTEEESDRPGDPSEKSASPNTASCSYFSKLQQHLNSSAESASNSSDDDSEGLCWGDPLETHHPQSLVTRPGLCGGVCMCVCVCVCSAHCQLMRGGMLRGVKGGCCSC